MTEAEDDESLDPWDWFARAARADKPDLAVLCLLLGAVVEASPHRLEADEAERIVDEGQIELDRLTGLLPYAPHRTAEQWAVVLAELLGDRMGFEGAPNDYQRLDSSSLGAVLRRRRGLPILLSVVWLEVARRAGAPVRGVALPGHFVVGFGGRAPDERPGDRPAGESADDWSGLVLADPFAGGRLLTPTEARLLVSGTTGQPLSGAMLRPATPLETVLRVLNNIRAWAARRPEHTDVQLAAIDLSLLLPHHPARLRHERAKLLVERGDFLHGARELEAYAELLGDAEPQAAESVRQEARHARARLN